MKEYHRLAPDNVQAALFRPENIHSVIMQLYMFHTEVLRDQILCGKFKSTAHSDRSISGVPPDTPTLRRRLRPHLLPQDQLL